MRQARAGNAAHRATSVSINLAPFVLTRTVYTCSEMRMPDRSSRIGDLNHRMKECEMAAPGELNVAKEPIYMDLANLQV